MIKNRDDYGYITKEAETPEEYLLLEIERLKQENEELIKELENAKIGKTFQWVLTSIRQEAKFLTTICEDGKVIIEKVEGSKNE